MQLVIEVFFLIESFVFFSFYLLLPPSSCVSQATVMAEIQPDERDGIEECKVSSEVSVENADSDLKLHYDGDMQTTIEFDR